jgi:hypothetical protein
VFLDQDQLASFERDGYVVVRGLFGESSLERLREHSWGLIPAPFQRDRRSTWTERIEDSCTNVGAFHRKGLLKFKDIGFGDVPLLRAEVVENAKLRDAAMRLVGADLEAPTIRGIHPMLPMPGSVSIDELVGGRLSRTRPGRWLSGIRVPRWFAWPIPGHLEVHIVQLASVVYLTPVGKGGGAVRVWPGSHRRFHPHFRTRSRFLPLASYYRLRHELDCFDSIEVPGDAGDAGDVVFLHHRLFHANGINTTTGVRHALVVDFCGKAWSRASSLPPAAEMWEHWSDELRAIAAARSGRSEDPAPRRSLVRAFWVRHPRLWEWISSISKDPAGRVQRMISRAERHRTPGDAWLVVSQHASHSRSWKLTAHGNDSLRGCLRIRFNGGPSFRLKAGCLVQPLRLSPGENTLEVSGHHSIPLFMRIVKTSIPVERSRVVWRKQLPPGGDVKMFRFEAKDAAAGVPG